LKDTEYKIYEDIPQERLDERKKLLPRKARKEGKRAYLSKAEPDKLIILNAQIYSQLAISVALPETVSLSV